MVLFTDYVFLPRAGLVEKFKDSIYGYKPYAMVQVIIFMNIYYKIWAEAIKQAQKNKGEEVGWKWIPLTAISFLMGVNLFTLLLLLHAFNRDLLLIFPIHIFKGVGYNSGLSIMLTYFLPFLILNYLLIFSNNQHQAIILKYRTSNAKLYRYYVLGSLGILLIPLLLKVAFFS